MDFNAEPFWDDFEASNGAKDQNYVRILFRPGYAVQARELTQIQSIIQDQLKSFGDHIFKDGSPVYGGHLTLDTSVAFIKLDSAYNGQDIDVADYEDRVIFNNAGTAKKRAKVLAIYESDTTPTLMIRYLRGTQFDPGETITTSSGSLATVIAADGPYGTPSGFGSIAHIDTGIFYVDGFFVHVQPQSVVLDPYGNMPTYKVGLEIEDEIMDESGDANLLDPAQESFNYQAPGAHRYKFALNLSKRALDSIDDQKFFELMRVENGVVTKQVNYPIYSEVEDMLARRTYDESGDYVVRPFGINFSANTSDATKFLVNIEPGKAYVKGFEYETIGTQKLNANKARNSQKATDFDLSIEYGNYVITKDVATSTNGLPNLKDLVTVDLHCVPKNNINYSTAATYNTTVIGSARLVNLDRSGSEYITYLTDINLTSNIVTAASTGGKTTIVFPSSYSDTANAYANVQFRVVSGNSAGDIGTITSYDGTSKTATIDNTLTGLVGLGNTVEIIYSTEAINSIVEPLATKTSANLKMNVSTTSKTTEGKTLISDSNKRVFIYPLPEGYIAKSSIVNADYYYRATYRGLAFSAGSYTLSLTNETFPYGADGSSLSSTTIADNMILVDRSTGSIVTPTVTRTSNTQITITTNPAITSGDLYITLKVDNSENYTVRTKTLVGSDSQTTITASNTYNSGTTAVTGQSSVYVNTTDGFIWFTDNSIINKEPNGATSLYVPDVFKIKAIYDSGDPNTLPSATNATDVTSRFFLDSGQRDNMYDHSAIVLKPGSTAPKGKVVVLAQFYTHSSGSGYFSVDSYNNSINEYDNGRIPIYVNSDGAAYFLRDCLDFRPSRVALTTAKTFIGMKNHKPNVPIELTYQYYLPRVDSVVLTADRELKVIEGIPDKVPAAPALPESVMELYTLNIPAYTANTSDIKAKMTQNKRYTMKDIGNLEKRVKNLEYYTSMSLSEKASKEKTLLYKDNATQKEKYGMVVDNFESFSIADVSHPDYHAAIDGGGLFPVTDLHDIKLSLRYTDGVSVKINDKTITLPYTETPVVEQLMATANCSVQPYMYGKFDGMLKLSPEIDTGHSMTIQPEVISPVQTVITEPASTITGPKVSPTSDRHRHFCAHYDHWNRKVGRITFGSGVNANCRYRHTHRSFTHSPLQAVWHKFHRPE